MKCLPLSYTKTLLVMANMSYCRMENTYHDLKDVFNNMDNVSSESEHDYRERIIKLAHRIADLYEPEHFGEFEDEEYEDEE